MNVIVKMREKLEELYAKYDTYINALLKFFFALFLLLSINGQTGYMERLTSITVVLILALVCAVLPMNGMVFIMIGVMAAQLYGLSISACLVGGGVLFMVLLLYFGLVPKDGCVLLLTYLALSLRMPLLIPLIFGLLYAPASMLGIAFGVISYYTVRDIGAMGQGVADGQGNGPAMAEEIKGYIGSIMADGEMFVTIILLCAVLMVVYLIKRMAIKYAWSIAIGCGCIVYIVIFVAGQMILGYEQNYFWVVTGIILSVAMAVLLQMFVFNLDYKKIQNLQFEDDEYYYYVQAVPKRMKGQDEDGEYKDIL